MQIDYRVKSVYGNDYMYIADETLASHICGLTGRKTLNHSDMRHLKSLGFVFNQVV